MGFSAFWFSHHCHLNHEEFQRFTRPLKSVKRGGDVFRATVLWLCFKLQSCLFGNTRDTSVMHEKAKFVCFNYATAKSEIQNCSNKHVS